MIREEVQKLEALGPMPSSDIASDQQVEAYEQSLQRIRPPLTAEEAARLVKLFGPDDYFGLAWTLLHLLETTPGWPAVLDGAEGDSEWLQRLRQRASR